MSHAKTIWVGDDGLILVGDVFASLEHLEDASVDAIITDPPYELNFMGRDWDRSGVSFDPKTWAACARVLKPGGHLLAFGGTRTYHRIWVAVEDAGFEIRDTLVWLYGQGMPKSLNLAVAFDKAEGMKARGRGFTVAGYTPAATIPGGAHGPHEATSELGRKWQGWGTALKPAWEPILLARKPLAEDTVAANVARYGTGAMNIDDSRVPVVGETVHTPQSDPSKRKGVVGSDLGFSKGTSEKMQEAQRASVERTNTLGRWPANVLLECICDDPPAAAPEKVAARQGEASQERRYDDKGATDFAAQPGARRTGGGVVHTEPECPGALLDAQSGQSKSSGVINRFTDGAKPFGGGAGHPYESVPGHQDEGGASRFFLNVHTNPDCPAALLDEQTGNLTSGKMKAGQQRKRSKGKGGYGDGMPDEATPLDTFGDSGGASRFFYCSKAPKKERGDANNHPTVKPLALMRWLIKLVTPPDGIVLDPFCGSGSTLVAAKQEGFEFIGIDISADYCATAEKRVTEAECEATQHS